MMMTRPLAALAALPFILLTSVARAENISVAEAEKRFDEGKQLFAQGHYEEARVKFSEACAAHPTARCPKNLGLAEYRLGHAAESATHLREYVAKADPHDADLATIRAVFEDVRARCGELEVVAPGGAKLAIDGAAAGMAPLDATLFVAPGPHEVTARWGAELDSKRVDVAARGRERVELGAARLPPPPPTTKTVRPAAGWAVPIALGVLGLGAFGAGMGLGVASSNARDGALASGLGGACAGSLASPGCTSARGDWSSAGGLGGASVSLYVGGAALVATAAILFFVWPKREITSALYVLPGAVGGTFQ